ncbi:MAG: alanine racemase [Propionibacteriaceae bacterium]|nr:alanine racemase [Propionibacteriaceae bacterium]
MTTSLPAIESNLRAIRSQVGERGILAALKANAYGHGIVEVSQMIEKTNAADWLGVAKIAEGAKLREAGISLPILNLSVARGNEISQGIVNQISLTVVDELSATQISQAASELQLPARVQLKVDTGMGRIGCRCDEAMQLAEQIMTSPHLILEGIFSHMPVSDDPTQDDFSARQIERFAQTCQEVEKTTGQLLKHLANSGAILAHPDSWFDMVRPGIMCYGAYPSQEVPKAIALAAALTWTTEVSFVKKVAAGETVSYGRTWTASEPTWIATIPVGYGDGYSRALSNKGRVLIRGASYPIVGRVCMDQFMVELGAQTDVVVGDQVTLIGRDHDEEITTSEIAALMETIPYEVTCLITDRVLRSYNDNPG